MINLALLSHRVGNIGHNFMALGAEAVARDAVGNQLDIHFIEQHRPFSIYPGLHPLRTLDFLPHSKFQSIRKLLGKEVVYKKLWLSLRRLNFNLAVSCGGPNLISNASTIPQMSLLHHQFNGAFHYSKVPLLDLAVGSCFPLERVPENLGYFDKVFYEKAFKYVTKLTVRESIAKKIFSSMGIDVEVVPCIAVASGRYFETIINKLPLIPLNEKVVLINFQALGSNEDWGQNVDASRWADLVRGVVVDLNRLNHKVEFLCHSQPEYQLAKSFWPNANIFFPKNEAEYAVCISRAKVGFVSRIHAGVALAGIGVPSVVVGNDTRIGTTTEFGLPSFFTKNISKNQVVSKILDLISNLDKEKLRLINLREEVILRYVNIFRRAMMD